MGLTKQQRGCWAVWAYAPEGVTMRQANDAINAIVADKARGLVLFHDHFADKPGGMAIFDIETKEQLAALQEPGAYSFCSCRYNKFSNKVISLDISFGL